MADLISLVCPSCGGKLQVARNATSLICDHYGNENSSAPLFSMKEYLSK